MPDRDRSGRFFDDGRRPGYVLGRRGLSLAVVTMVGCVRCRCRHGGRHRPGGLRRRRRRRGLCRACGLRCAGAAERLCGSYRGVVVAETERRDRPLVEDLGRDEDDEKGDRDPDQGHPRYCSREVSACLSNHGQCSVIGWIST